MKYYPVERAICLPAIEGIEGIPGSESGIRTRKRNLSTLRSSFLVEQSAKAHQKECQLAIQGSEYPGANLFVKRAVVDSWKAFE
jgi:hypothetical protein